ncbi:putative oligopeptidase A [Rosa chinensis]|uniref:Putative oligopeptidase A n=1 Tax=Rosa chinensis TaxID=74649 RepID=A0A2P6PG66_ROSCH|nr:putative oligopeptidase A [Rosa chinensis]
MDALFHLLYVLFEIHIASTDDTALVQTIFHEFGHAFQLVLTKQDELLVANFQNIEKDCIDVPSTFLDKWCYHGLQVNSLHKSFKLYYASKSS